MNSSHFSCPRRSTTKRSLSLVADVAARARHFALLFSTVPLDFARLRRGYWWPALSPPLLYIGSRQRFVRRLVLSFPLSLLLFSVSPTHPSSTTRDMHTPSPRIDCVRLGPVLCSLARFGSARFASVRFASADFASVGFASVGFASVRLCSARLGSLRFDLVWFGCGSVRSGLDRTLAVPLSLAEAEPFLNKRLPL